MTVPERCESPLCDAAIAIAPPATTTTAAATAIHLLVRRDEALPAGFFSTLDSRLELLNGIAPLKIHRDANTGSDDARFGASGVSADSSHH